MADCHYSLHSFRQRGLQAELRWTSLVNIFQNLHLNRQCKCHLYHNFHRNDQGVFLHVLADALGSVVVLVSAAIIWLSDWQYRWCHHQINQVANPSFFMAMTQTWSLPPPFIIFIRDYLDPILSIVIVMIILISTWPLLRQYLQFLSEAHLNIRLPNHPSNSLVDRPSVRHSLFGFCSCCI